jgi:hypothetical protein
MSKFFRFCAVLVTAFAVTACGGSGGGSSDASPTPPTVIPQVADMTFVNVPTNPLKTSVIPGEKDREVAAFRIEGSGTVEQMVFKSSATVSLSSVIASIRLFVSDGIDVNVEAPYSVTIDDVHHKLVFDFVNQWTPVDGGVVPRTYSVIMSFKPSATPGTVLALELSAVQMHDAGKTIAMDVKGESLKLANVAGVSLPIITASSPASTQFADDVLGSFVQTGSFDASCPAESTNVCTLTEVIFSATGAFNPTISVDGLSFNSFPVVADFTFSSWVSDMSVLLQPGETKTFTITSLVFQSPVFMSVIDMTWTVGPNGTRVNAIFPKGPASCAALVTDGTGCKGV